MTTRTAQFAVLLAASFPTGAFAAQGSPFGSHTFLPTSGPYARINSGDVNRDGNLDLVVLGLTILPSQVQTNQTLLGNGSGGFVAAAPQLAGSNVPWPVDWDADGGLDFVSAAGGTMAIALGAATGQFVSGGTLAVPFSFAARESAGDLNGDGVTDLLHSGYLTAELYVTDGGTASTTAIPGVTGGQGLIADYDLDGDLDVLCTTWNSILALQQISPGNFQLGNSSPGASGPLFTSPGAIVIGKADGNATIDLIHLPPMSPVMGLFLGSTSGAFTPTAYNLTASSPLLGVNPLPGAIADVTGDGLGDLLSFGGSTIHVRSSVSPGVWGSAQPLNAPANVTNLAVADFNSDGLLDLAAGLAGSSSAALYLNLLGTPAGTSTFGTGTPGCNGTQGLSAMSLPELGNARFGLQTTQTPSQSLGLLILCDVASIPGADPFGIGLLLHVAPQLSTTIVALDAPSDVFGLSTVALPIPNNAGLLGSTFNAETIWAWQPCSPSPFKLSSSKALSFTVIP